MLQMLKMSKMSNMSKMSYMYNNSEMSKISQIISFILLQVKVDFKKETLSYYTAFPIKQNNQLVSQV